LFQSYVDDFLALRAEDLGPRPPGLLDLLTNVALGSPAVCAARTLLSSSISSERRRELAVKIADALFRLFNRPTVITLLNKLASEETGGEREEAYWRRVLQYCRAGNLQAVFDEQWHLLWEQYDWSDQEKR